MISFKDKTAIVTGGTRGIGRSIVLLLLNLGAKVIYTGTRKKDKHLLREADYWRLDLSDALSTSRFMHRLRKLSKLDILVNNAGINIIEPIVGIKEEHWNKVIQVNLTGAMLVMREVSRIMKRSKTAGRILNISSILGIISKEKRNAYSSSKSGLIGLTKAAALDLAPYNILVNALCPGFTMTDLTASILSKEEIKHLSSEIPLKRFVREDEIAKIAVFLCSDLNSYMTGQTLVADGGFIIR